MSKEYSTTINVSFENSYWQLTYTVESSTGVDSSPFLVEMWLPADTQASANSEEAINFIRCLLEEDISEYPKYSPTYERDLPGWYQFRTNSITDTFYSYDRLESRLKAIKAILSSNTRNYPNQIDEPLKVQSKNVTNPDLEGTDTTKTPAYIGDTIVLKIRNFSGEYNITTNPGLSFTDVKRGSTVLLRITDNPAGLYTITLNDLARGESIDTIIEVMETPVSGTISEVL